MIPDHFKPTSPHSATGRVGTGRVLWSPLIPFLVQEAEARGGVSMVISPFARKEAVLRLLSKNTELNRSVVMCRWSAADLVTGIADLDLYPALEEIGVPLFIHPTIHLKLYIFADRHALQASGNATGSGLGFHGDQVEIGALSVLTEQDDRNIGALFAGATRVTDQVHSELKEYQATHRATQPALPPLPASAQPAAADDSVTSGTTLDSLPLSRSPGNLAQILREPASADPVCEVTIQNDLEVLGQDLSVAQDPAALAAQRFLSLPLARCVAERLQARGHAQFGVLRAWLTELTVDSEDIPPPQVDQIVGRFRSWLAASHPRIEADQPKHTQMLYWRNDEQLEHPRP